MRAAWRQLTEWRPIGAEFVESCTTIRVNPSPDTKTGTATAHALAACVGAVIIDFGTTERTGG